MLEARVSWLQTLFFSICLALHYQIPIYNSTYMEFLKNFQGLSTTYHIKFKLQLLVFCKISTCSTASHELRSPFANPVLEREGPKPNSTTYSPIETQSLYRQRKVTSSHDILLASASPANGMRIPSVFEITIPNSCSYFQLPFADRQAVVCSSDMGVPCRKGREGWAVSSCGRKD